MAATRKSAKQSVTIFVKDINDETFWGALEKIDASPALKGEKAWAYADFKQACDELQKRATDKYKELLFSSVETEVVMIPNEAGDMVPAKDDKGVEIHRIKILRDDQGRPHGYVHKNPQAFQEKWEALLSESITATLIPLTSAEAAEVGLTPKELRAIRVLIADATPEPRHDLQVYSS